MWGAPAGAARRGRSPQCLPRAEDQAEAGRRALLPPPPAGIAASLAAAAAAAVAARAHPRRHLHIPLVCAERAWSYAMELKNQIEQNLEARKRQHLIRRLAKAAVRRAGEGGLRGAGHWGSGRAAWRRALRQQAAGKRQRLP